MKKLKLSAIDASILEKDEMHTLVGGQKVMIKSYCACGCKYQAAGGSTTRSNGNANISAKKVTPGMKCLEKMSLEELCDIYLPDLLE